MAKLRPHAVVGLLRRWCGGGAAVVVRHLRRAPLTLAHERAQQQVGGAHVALRGGGGDAAEFVDTADDLDSLQGADSGCVVPNGARCVRLCAGGGRTARDEDDCEKAYGDCTKSSGHVIRGSMLGNWNRIRMVGDGCAQRSYDRTPWLVCFGGGATD